MIRVTFSILVSLLASTALAQQHSFEIDPVSCARSQTVDTGTTETVEIVYSDGLSVVAGPDTVLTASCGEDGVTIEVQSGTARVAGGLSNAETPIRIMTPQSEMSLSAGAAFVSVMGTTTRAHLLNGQTLQVISGGVERLIYRPGFEVRSSGGAPSVPRRMPVEQVLQDVRMLSRGLQLGTRPMLFGPAPPPIVTTRAPAAIQQAGAGTTPASSATTMTTEVLGDTASVPPVSDPNLNYDVLAAAYGDSSVGDLAISSDTISDADGSRVLDIESIDGFIGPRANILIAFVDGEVVVNEGDGLSFGQAGSGLGGIQFANVYEGDANDESGQTPLFGGALALVSGYHPLDRPPVLFDGGLPTINSDPTLFGPGSGSGYPDPGNLYLFALALDSYGGLDAGDRFMSNYRTLDARLFGSGLFGFSSGALSALTASEVNQEYANTFFDFDQLNFVAPLLGIGSSDFFERSATIDASNDPSFPLGSRVTYSLSGLDFDTSVVPIDERLVSSLGLVGQRIIYETNAGSGSGSSGADISARTFEGASDYFFFDVMRPALVVTLSLQCDGSGCLNAREITFEGEANPITLGFDAAAGAAADYVKQELSASRDFDLLDAALAEKLKDFQLSDGSLLYELGEVRLLAGPYHGAVYNFEVTNPINRVAEFSDIPVVSMYYSLPSALDQRFYHSGGRLGGLRDRLLASGAMLPTSEPPTSSSYTLSSDPHRAIVDAFRFLDMNTTEPVDGVDTFVSDTELAGRYFAPGQTWNELLEVPTDLEDLVQALPFEPGLAPSHQGISVVNPARIAVSGDYLVDRHMLFADMDDESGGPMEEDQRPLMNVPRLLHYDLGVYEVPVATGSDQKLQMSTAAVSVGALSFRLVEDRLGRGDDPNNPGMRGDGFMFGSTIGSSRGAEAIKLGEDGVAIRPSAATLFYSDWASSAAGGGNPAIGTPSGATGSCNATSPCGAQQGRLGYAVIQNIGTLYDDAGATNAKGEHLEISAAATGVDDTAFQTLDGGSISSLRAAEESPTDLSFGYIRLAEGTGSSIVTEQRRSLAGFSGYAVALVERERKNGDPDIELFESGNFTFSQFSLAQNTFEATAGFKLADLTDREPNLYDGNANVTLTWGHLSAYAHDGHFAALSYDADSQTFSALFAGPELIEAGAFGDSLETVWGDQTSDQIRDVRDDMKTYDHVQWGFFLGDRQRGRGGMRDHIHLGSFATGDTLSSAQLNTLRDTERLGRTAFTGHMVGNVLNDGQTYTAVGSFKHEFDFGRNDWRGTGTARFDHEVYETRTIATDGGDHFRGGMRSGERAGTLGGRFVGLDDRDIVPRGAVGRFRITGDDYLAAGTFGAERD